MPKISTTTFYREDRILKSQTRPLLIYLYVVILGCASLFGTPAYAGTETLLELLKVLRDRGTISQAEFEALSTTVRVDEKKESSKQVTLGDEANKITEQEQSKKKVRKPPQDSMKVKTGSDKALSVESADGAFAFSVGGRLQIDAGFVDDDETPLGSGAELRRARIKLKGTMWRIWDYQFQPDFGEEEMEIKDAFIKFKGLKSVSFTLGQQKLPFTLQSWTSNNWQVFQERALMNSFIEDDAIGRRRFGLKVSTHGSHWTALVGLFGEGADHGGPFNESWAPMGRVTFAPIAEANHVLHLGASAYYRNYEHDPELVFTSHPEEHIAPGLVNTGVISGTEDALLLSGELSTVWGPFHAQGEYLHVKLGRRNGLPDPHFDGWYVQAGYFLTGESRNYKGTEGHYDRIFPKSIVGQDGWGAWEIAARYSNIDLTDKGILGGVENNFTAALNWYVNPNVMFRVNYIHAETGPSSIVGPGVNEAVNIYTLRGQIVF
ncbi:porin [Nitrospira sp. M1]